MQRQIDDLKRSAQQGSQQLQGEVQELELESLLRNRFPTDTIDPVPKGEFGGDALQKVIGKNGSLCGTILWESKRTKNWSDGWLPKLRDDQRAAKAEISIMITQSLPKGVDTFDLIDGVWVTHPRFTIPVALAIRQYLIELSAVRQSAVGQQSKAEILYTYLTGPKFRLRIEAIVEGFANMKVDLERERKLFTKHWAKRDQEIERAMLAALGMFGDVQGIAGNSLKDLEGLDFDGLEEKE